MSFLLDFYEFAKNIILYQFPQEADGQPLSSFIYIFY